jgi:hypothetical protein
MTIREFWEQQVQYYLSQGHSRAEAVALANLDVFGE